MASRIGILNMNNLGLVPRPTAMFGVRNGWTVLARKSHASVRRLDVPLGRKLSVGSGQ
jgi:hypothetical protein